MSVMATAGNIRCFTVWELSVASTLVDQAVQSCNCTTGNTHQSMHSVNYPAWPSSRGPSPITDRGATSNLAMSLLNAAARP